MLKETARCSYQICQKRKKKEDFPHNILSRSSITSLHFSHVFTTFTYSISLISELNLSTNIIKKTYTFGESLEKSKFIVTKLCQIKRLYV